MRKFVTLPLITLLSVACGGEASTTPQQQQPTGTPAATLSGSSVTLSSSTTQPVNLSARGRVLKALNEWLHGKLPDAQITEHHGNNPRPFFVVSRPGKPDRKIEVFILETPQENFPDGGTNLGILADLYAEHLNDLTLTGLVVVPDHQTAFHVWDDFQANAEGGRYEILLVSVTADFSVNIEYTFPNAFYLKTFQ